MKLEQVDSQTPTRDFIIEKPIYGLRVACELSVTSGFSPSPHNYFNLIAISEIIGGSISIKYKTKGGQTTRPMNSIDIQTLLEFSQFGEGMIDLSLGANGNYFMTGIIPFSDSGALAFNNDESLIITVTKLSGGFDTINLETIENPIFGFDYYDFTTLDVVSGAREKVFPVSEYDTIMIPLKDLDSSTELTFHHTNGVSIDYNSDTLYLMGQTVNDVCYNIDGQIISGYGRFAILNLDTVKNLEINRTSSDAFSMTAIRTDIVGNLKEVQEVNNKLQHTSLAKFDTALINQKIK